MRSIPLISFSLDSPSGSEEVSYKDLIKNCVSGVPPSSNGVDIEEMRLRMKILDALDNLKAPKKELLLEEPEYKKLVECLNSMRWRVLDKGIIKFHDDVIGAKEVQVSSTK